MNKYDLQHLRNFGALQKQINAIYNAAAEEAAAIGQLIPTLPADAIFAFKDYPITHDRIRELLQYLYAQTFGTIENGINVEWALANDKNDALVRRVFGDISALTDQQQRKYLANNDGARAAFISRQTEGLKLSERVWRYANDFKSEIELGIDIGIRDGRDARGMARDLKQYLRHPDKLFRRVRDEHGNLQLSKAAAAFHPGRGVYRSSYKNALRLAATETNMAYRTADQERWKDFDFVVGQRVCLSPTNHPVADICDELKGEYPKDFKFVGWHPHCRCYVESILKSDKELKEDTRRIIRGEQPTDDSTNAVNDTPPNFDAWVKDNQWRIEHAKTPPYFIRDNRSRIDDILNGKKRMQSDDGMQPTAKRIKTPQEVAAERHARRDAAEVQRAWNARRYDRVKDLYIDVRKAYHTSEICETFAALEKMMQSDTIDQRTFNNTIDRLKSLLNEALEKEIGATEQLMTTPLFAENNAALAAMFGTRGTAMTFRRANRLHGNPHYHESEAYKANCQTCVMANELRRRGFDIEALPNIKGSALEKLSYHTETAWLDAAGNIPQSTIIGARRIEHKSWVDPNVKYYTWEKTVTNRKQLISAFESDITEDGRYHFHWTWKSRSKSTREGHIITAERINGKMYYYDPQNGKEIFDLNFYLDGIDLSRGIQYLRVDNLRVNPNIAKDVLTKPTAAAKAG